MNAHKFTMNLIINLIRGLIAKKKLMKNSWIISGNSC